MNQLEVWKFIAGLGLFLYGMNQLEALLKKISGRPLKLFLKRNTQSLFKSISGGAIVTGIVQSSSIVSLIVLAFVESGIITFKNALGVILGANLGTTLSSWLVATIGFKVDILNYALPVIAVTTLGMFFLRKRKKLYNLFAVMFALGIMFFGLSFMKESALQLVNRFDLSTFNHYGLFVFVIIGFVITTIIQASSATIAITLTAVYAGLLTFPSAAAIVIGSEVGTTIKVLLWGMTGSSDKMRVAYGSFFFNIFTSFFAFIFLNWLVHLIEDIIKIKDPLIGLVMFQTTINILSIILFVPFLNPFVKWLEKNFSNSNDRPDSYFGKNPPIIPFLAVDTIKKEGLNLLRQSILFNKRILSFGEPNGTGLLNNLKSLTDADRNINDDYNKLKQTEGDILEYYLSMQENNQSETDAMLILQYMDAVRQSVYGAKAVKDISHNLKDFNTSANDVLFDHCEIIREQWDEFDGVLNHLIDMAEKDQLPSQIDKIFNEVFHKEEKHKSEVVSLLKHNKLNELEASTLMNVYRALYSAKKSFLSAIGNLESPALLKQPYNL